ncbi:UNVERIFIED_CONTAM: hypothetical protein FKN15_023447 [Acipenser sinensis]
MVQSHTEPVTCTMAVKQGCHFHVSSLRKRLSFHRTKSDGGAEKFSSSTPLGGSSPAQSGRDALLHRCLCKDLPSLQTEAGTSSRNDDGEAAAVVQRAEVEEPPRPEPRPRRKRPEEPGTSAAAAEPGAAAPADADKEGVYTAVVKKRKLKKRTSTAADPAAGEEESVWGPIMVSHDSDVGSQPSAVVEPSAGSEGQEKGGPQPADLVSEDPVLEGSDVGGDSLGAQAGPVDVPPSDETPQPAGSVAEMPAADGDSAGEEENGSAGSDEDGWEDGLSDTSQLSDITASQRGKLYSLTEISDFLEKTKAKTFLAPLKQRPSGSAGKGLHCSPDPLALNPEYQVFVSEETFQFQSIGSKHANNLQSKTNEELNDRSTLIQIPDTIQRDQKGGNRLIYDNGEHLEQLIRSAEAALVDF